MVKTKRFFSRMLCMFFAVFVMLQAFMPMKPAQAGPLSQWVWYIQVSIDVSNWAIVGSVVSDNFDRFSGVGGGTVTKEGMRLTEDQLNSIRNGSGTDVISSINIDTEADGTNNITSGLLLTWPGDVGLFGGSASTEDRDRATLVLNSLLYDMSAAFNMCYDTTAINASSDPFGTYKTNLIELLNNVESRSGTINGWTIRSATADDISKFADASSQISDYVVFEQGSEKQVFCYQIPKNPGSGEYITWETLAAEAFVNYSCGVGSGDVYSGEIGTLEKYIVEFCNSIVDFISGALGLWSFDELVFNEGIRGGSSYVYGIFPTNWQTTIWTFFFITEIIAIAMLLFSIATNVLKRARATVNPVIRANAMSQVEDLLMVVALLILLPFLLQIGFSLVASLSSLFGATLGDQTAQERFSGLATMSNSIGGVIISFLYLGALIYFNVYYYMRSIILAFLIIVAPISIAMIGLSENTKKLYQKWQNAIIGYTAIQPIHALILAIILLMPTTGRVIENIVCVYAMIPLGKMAKKMILPDTEADLADSIGEKGQQTGMNSIKQVGETAGKAAVGGLGAAAAAGILARQESRATRDRYDQGRTNTSGGGNSSDGSGGGADANNVSSANGDNKKKTGNMSEADQKKQNRANILEKAQQQESVGDSVADHADKAMENDDSKDANNLDDVTAGIGDMDTDIGGVTGESAGDGDSGKSTEEKVSEARQEAMDQVSDAQNDPNNNLTSEKATGRLAAAVAGIKNQQEALKKNAQAAMENTRTGAAMTRHGQDLADRREISDKEKAAKSEFLAHSGGTTKEEQQALRAAARKKNLGIAVAGVGGALSGAFGYQFGRGFQQVGMMDAQYYAGKEQMLRQNNYDNYHRGLEEQQRQADLKADRETPVRDIGNYSSYTVPNVDGSFDSELTQDEMQEFGIQRISADKHGNGSFDTNANLGDADRQQLAAMSKIFQGNDENAKALLRQNGYEEVMPIKSRGQETGEYRVKFNENYAGAHDGRVIAGTRGGGMTVSHYQAGASFVKPVSQMRPNYGNIRIEEKKRQEAVNQAYGWSSKPDYDQSSGNTKLHYSDANSTPAVMQNIVQAEAAFQSSNPQAAQVYRDAGIQNVTRTDDGQYEVIVNNGYVEKAGNSDVRVLNDVGYSNLSSVGFVEKQAQAQAVAAASPAHQTTHTPTPAPASSTTSTTTTTTTTHTPTPAPAGSPTTPRTPPKPSVDPNQAPAPKSPVAQPGVAGGTIPPTRAKAPSGGGGTPHQKNPSPKTPNGGPDNSRGGASRKK